MKDKPMIMIMTIMKWAMKKMININNSSSMKNSNIIMKQ
jgi:hypothetical protein